MKRLPTPELLSTLRHWGPRWQRDITAGRDAMFEAWAPLLEPAAIAPLYRDLPYGSDPRQVADIFAPEGASDLPILVFVHGGAFVRGDKAQTPWIHANVPSEFAKHGFVALNVEYRLAPQAAWPDGAADVRDAVLWIFQNAISWGGDPKQIFLMGHSAGGAHCATATWDDRVRPRGGLPIAGLILVSSRVIADTRAVNPNAHGVKAYYGPDDRVYLNRSPISRVRADAPPTFVVTAQYENPLLDIYSFDLGYRLSKLADAQNGPKPRFIQLADHNHVSVIAQFNTVCNELGSEIRNWCRRIASS